MRFDQNCISWLRQRQHQSSRNISTYENWKKTTQAGGLSGWSVTFQVLRMEPEVQFTAQSIQPLEFLTQINWVVQGVPYGRGGVCLSDQTLKKAISYLFRMDVSITFPPWCHFKRLLDMSTECLTCSGQHCAISCPVVRRGSGPLWIQHLKLLKEC